MRSAVVAGSTSRTFIRVDYGLGRKGGVKPVR